MNRAASLALALLLLPGACGPVAEPQTQRLVGSIPTDRFAFHRESVDDVFRWEFQQSADLLPWSIRADEVTELRDGMLWLAGSDRSSLVREVDLAARDVEVIEVRLDGLRSGVTRVYWAAAGDVFSPERQVGMRAAAGIDGVYRLAVGEHAQWRGRIRHLRIDATNSPDELVGVASIVGQRTSDALRDGAFDRVWGIDADGERRAGTVVTGSRAHELPLVTVDETRLHFAHALLTEPETRPARFSVTRVDTGATQEIWSREVASTSHGWQSESLELHSTGGEEVILRFAVTCADGDECIGAFGSMETRPGAAPQRPNVVLISIDTLRADRMSLYGNDNPTTPRIDAWAGAAGVTFEQTVAAAPWTLPSHTSMLTGLYATSHNVNYDSPISESLELLAEHLHGDGYFTAAVTGGGYVAADFGFWQGFDVYHAWNRDAVGYGNQATASGTELPANLQRASGILRETGERPFFLFFHTYEVHGPFHGQMPYFERFYPEADVERDTTAASRRADDDLDGNKLARRLYITDDDGQRPLRDDDLPLLHALYDSGVAYTDARIGELLDALEADGLLDNTIVVLTSDHGEMLGERDLGGHAYLYEPNLLIPLVISWPDRFPGGLRVDDQVGTVDIVPTVLELLGHEVPPELDGESLLPFLEGRSMSRAPEVISYAGVSNHGISLRLESGLKYVYENSLWRDGVVHSLAPIDPTSSAASLDFSARAAELRQQVEQLLEARAGLHMMLVNEEGPEDIVFRFRGPPMQSNRIKATRLACACARWLGGARNEIRLPAGQEIALQIEDPLRGTIFMEVRIGDEVHVGEVDIDDIDEPFVLDWREGSWQQISLRDELVRRGLALWWQGSGRGGDDGPMDEDLVRQLEALGYLR